MKKLLMVGTMAAVFFMVFPVEGGDVFGQIGKLIGSTTSQHAPSHRSDSTAGLSIAPDSVRTGEDIVAVFMHQLLQNGYQQGAQVVVPYIHTSLQSPLGKMSKDTYQFQYKKAHGNAKFYMYPVRIVRTRSMQLSSIGYVSDGTYEKGRKVKYFLARKNSATGLPASLEVFFPQNGGRPSISYMGNL